WQHAGGYRRALRGIDRVDHVLRLLLVPERLGEARHLTLPLERRERLRVLGSLVEADGLLIVRPRRVQEVDRAIRTVNDALRIDVVAYVLDGLVVVVAESHYAASSSASRS